MTLKTLLVFCYVFLSGCQLFAEDINIRSLRVYASSDETSFPVMIFTERDSGSITIDFDVDAGFYPDMNIVFRFCDQEWQPTQNQFLMSIGKDVYYNLRFDLLPSTITGARYHFKGSFPDREGYVTFPYSGKWMFFITDSFDTSKVYATGKFFVVRNALPVSVSLKRDQLEDNTYFPVDLAKAFNVTAVLSIPDNMYPSYVNRMEVIENRKINYPYIVDRQANSLNRQFYWDANRKFTFTARDIRPGNSYRQTDFRDINRFGSAQIKAQIDGIEQSRFFRSPSNDFNGGSVLTDFRSEFATYLNVEFSIRPPSEVTGRVFLVGAFNDWILSDDYLMDINSGIHSIILNLKRGAYDYQYVVADYFDDEIINPDWYVLEGNKWETTNEYHVFIYYNEQEFGGYEKIIAYNKIISR